MNKIHKMKMKQAKKLAVIMSIPEKQIQQIIIDFQDMGLLKHITENEWRLFDGKEWQSLKL